jgi:AcrR family transcriptional regulator
MTQKPSTKDTVLDAFERLVTDRGERAATIDAVAAEAGVSKGGLLYHFSSKSDLVDGLVARLERLTADDNAQLIAAPEGIVRRFIRSSVVIGTPFDSTYIAMTRLAQSGLYPTSNASLAAVEAGWRALIEQSVGDAAVARLVLLVSDGLYYNAALFPLDKLPTPTNEIDDVVDAIEELARGRSVTPPTG